jgi:hypothetical protein
MVSNDTVIQVNVESSEEIVSESDDEEIMSDDEELIEEKNRICKFEVLWADRDSKNHPFVGRAYKCEHCMLTGCRSCLMTDYWEERCKDNVFLCRTCLRFQQIIADIG